MVTIHDTETLGRYERLRGGAKKSCCNAWTNQGSPGDDLRLPYGKKTKQLKQQEKRPLGTCEGGEGAVASGQKYLTFTWLLGGTLGGYCVMLQRRLRPEYFLNFPKCTSHVNLMNNNDTIPQTRTPPCLPDPAKSLPKLVQRLPYVHEQEGDRVICCLLILILTPTLTRNYLPTYLLY